MHELANFCGFGMQFMFVYLHNELFWGQCERLCLSYLISRLVAVNILHFQNQQMREDPI